MTTQCKFDQLFQQHKQAAQQALTGGKRRGLGVSSLQKGFADIIANIVSPFGMRVEDHGVGHDIHVIDGDVVVAVFESKTYCETTMAKTIIGRSMLNKQQYPHAKVVVISLLENQIAEKSMHKIMNSGFIDSFFFLSRSPRKCTVGYDWWNQDRIDTDFEAVQNLIQAVENLNQR